VRPILIAAALALACAAAAHAATAAYSAPRTAFGDPDLQGVWTNASLTTLERMDGVTSPTLTPEQAAKLEAQTKAMLAADNRATDPNAGAPQSGRDPEGYNVFWLDFGSKFAVVDGQIRTSWIVDPADGKIPYSPAGGRAAMTAGMMQFNNFDNPEARSMGERCIVGYGSTGGPPMLNVLYNNNYQIVQSPGYVAILVEMNHDVRIIRLGGRHLPASMTPWMGDSVGHFEGDTLVVETTNINPAQAFTADIRHRIYVAPDATVTERFTRIAPDQILYRFAVASPTAYTQTWRGEIPMRTAKGPIYEYACHEGNYALPDILGGARAQEARKTAAAGGGR
jgi:hypothetical protein